MTYKVLKIEEDLDFGCEERNAFEPVMAVVTLVDEKDMIRKQRIADELLYKEDIAEGDFITFDSAGIVKKRTVKVVAAIILHNNRILATRREYGPFKGGWEFPGGNRSIWR